MSQLNVGKVVSTSGVQFPSYTTENLPTTGIEPGFVAFDSSAVAVKYWDGLKWRLLDDVGDISTDGGIKYKFGEYTIHKFLTSDVFEVNNISGGATMDILMVGGGGAGGAADGNCSNGGGGAGGLVYKTGVPIAVGAYPVIIGTGGNGYANQDIQGDNGGDTSFYGFTALGGGGGGGGGGVAAGGGRAGGSGGGGAHPFNTSIAQALQPNSPTGGFGSAGGAGNNSTPQWGGGGGGGAGTAGQNGTANTGGAGGIGLQYDIDGVNKYYAGGGAGALCGAGGHMLGGLGGGGNGTSFNRKESSSGPGYDGGDGLGGGGGGAGYNSSYRSLSGSGGNGIVVIRIQNRTLDNTVGQSSINPAVNAAQILVENPGAPSGLYWIKPEGYSGNAQQIYCDMTNGEGWMLVSSNNAADSNIAGGTGRYSANFFLNRSGALGTPNPDLDYIIGSMINDLNFQNARVVGYGWDSLNGTYSWANLGTYVDVRWPLNAGGADRLVEVQPRSRVSVSGTGSISGLAAYFVLDGVQGDFFANGVFDSNQNQITIGGTGVQGQYGDPRSGTYLGHGTTEGSYEGWYDASNASRNCQGYTTWVR
jgi:hypothetical protein